jgi:uncharacterized protein
MDPISLIKKYYTENSQAYEILVNHSLSVTQKALQIAEMNPQENFDIDFVKEAAMLHDIGIFMTNAPRIFCFGGNPYIAHGYLGSELLQKEGLFRHALVCERHTGTGISLAQIQKHHLPLPHRDMMPVSPEEQLICFADKFFSKTRLGEELSIDKIRKTLSNFGDDSVSCFDIWCDKWLK